MPARTHPAGGERWSFRLGALAIGLLVAFLLGELAARAMEYARGLGSAGREWEGNIYEFCADRHHRLVPNGAHRHVSREYDYVWRNNSLGMRDRERTAAKPPGDFRILVLGDSMVQGHGVKLEDAMTMRLEARLNQGHSGGPIEVLNAGIFGYSPFLEKIYLRELLERTGPDVVLVGFFLGNDVGEDAFYAGKARVSADGSTVAFKDEEWPWSIIEAALDGVPDAATGSGGGGNGGGGEDAAPWWDPLRRVARRSRLLALAKTALDASRYPARREREFELVRSHRGDIRYDVGLVNYDVLDREKRLAYWRLSLQSLDDMAALCRGRGVPMAVVVIPPAERLLGLTRFEEPYQVLEEFGRGAGVPVIQLLPGLLARGSEALYFKYDRHWTPEGHAAAAEILFGELRRLGLAPVGPPS